MQCSLPVPTLFMTTNIEGSYSSCTCGFFFSFFFSLSLHFVATAFRGQIALSSKIFGAFWYYTNIQGESGIAFVWCGNGETDLDYPESSRPTRRGREGLC